MSIYFDLSQYVSVTCCSIVVNVLDSKIEISEFKLYSRNNTHFRTNTIRKGKSLLSPQLGIKKYNCFSGIMALVLNNLRRLICH